MGRLAAMGVLATVMGCDGLSASTSPCTILCSSELVCPSGMACATDGYCHDDGDATDCSPADQAPDAAPPTMNQCGPCNHPPTMCASDCEAWTYATDGACVNGECVYEQATPTSCPYGCDWDTGHCRDEGISACVDEICDLPSECGGVCHLGSGCILQLALDISGDCVTASCPLAARYPVGCDIVMSGSDSRGCIANEPSSSVVFFKEGNKCDVGHVSGTLLCSSTIGAGLNETNCPMNKSNSLYPTDPGSCPN